MTADTAKQILMILRGSYPAEGWKLDGDNAKAFIASMLMQLGKYPDRFVLRAAQQAIDASLERIPSVPLMAKMIKAEVNKVREYKELPTPPVNEAGRKRIHGMIDDLRSKWTKRPNKEKKPPSLDDVPKDVIEFARRAVPGIPDELIIKNVPAFKEGMACNMRMGNEYMRFWLDPNTGLVSMTIVMKRGVAR